MHHLHRFMEMNQRLPKKEERTAIVYRLMP